MGLGKIFGTIRVDRVFKTLPSPFDDITTSELYEDDSPTFLVADDNMVYINVLSKALEIVGGSVITVKDGYQALELCKKSKFSVIFVDRHMPFYAVIEICNKIKTEKHFEINYPTPVIIVTASF